MREILIVGAGKSTSVLINYLLQQADSEDLFLRIGDFDIENARKACNNHQKCEAFELDVFKAESREPAIKKADIIISMLPARFHIEVAKDCLKFGKNMVTASYISDEMKALDEEVKSKGLVFMNEIGVDPGIDHMSAMQVIDRITR